MRRQRRLDNEKMQEMSDADSNENNSTCAAEKDENELQSSFYRSGHSARALEQLDADDHCDAAENHEHAPTLPLSTNAYTYSCFTIGPRWLLNCVNASITTCYDVGMVVKQITEKVFADTVKVPHNYREAMKSPQAAEWKAAVGRENDSLRKHGVFQHMEFSEVPFGQK